MKDKEEYVILFGPKDGKSLLRLYPELSDEPSFKDIPSDELNFVWHFANQSSPIDPDMSHKDRAALAATRAFAKNPEKMKRFSTGVFDDNIKVAVKKMASYSPEARAVAKRIAQTTFNNYLKLVNVDVKDFEYVDKDGNKMIDWTGRNQYVNSAAKINEVMPTLLKQIEGGYGIETKSADSAFNGKKAIDIFHKNN